MSHTGLFSFKASYIIHSSILISSAALFIYPAKNGSGNLELISCEIKGQSMPSEESEETLNFLGHLHESLIHLKGKSRLLGLPEEYSLYNNFWVLCETVEVLELHVLKI